MNRLRSCVAIGQHLASGNLTGTRSIARWVGPTLRQLVQRKRRAAPEDPVVRSTFLEWNRNAELYAFNERLSEKFEPELLARAFVFPSYLAEEAHKRHEAGMPPDSVWESGENSELIEAGHRTSVMIVEAYLRQALPRAPLECIRALLEYLTSEEVLAEISTALGTTDLVLSTEQPISKESLAGAFLALVGALEQSPDVDRLHVGNFVRDFVIARLAEKDLTEIWRPRNPEELLNEILARESRALAEPRLIGHAGVRTLLAVYRVAFYSSGQFLGKGFGETIEEARETAALEALYRMFGLGDSCKPMRFDLATSEASPENLPLAQWCAQNVDKVMRQ